MLGKRLIEYFASMGCETSGASSASYVDRRNVNPWSIFMGEQGEDVE